MELCNNVLAVLTTLCTLVSSLTAVYNESLYRDFERITVSVGVTEKGHSLKLSDRYDLDTLDSVLNHGEVKKITITLHLLRTEETIIFHLDFSPLILPKTLKVAYFKDNVYGSRASYKYIDSNKFSCFYADYGEQDQLLSHFELCNGAFEGEVLVGLNNTFLIKMIEGQDRQLSFSMVKKQEVSPGKCGNANSNFETLHRSIRSAREIHAPSFRNQTTRYIELYVAVDNALYIRSGKDITKTTQRVINIINYASSLFLKMNIYLALVGTEIWSSGNKFNVTGAADTVLALFEQYRHDVISPLVPNDNANLFVAQRFYDSTVGQASASMCVSFGGCAATADHYVNDWIASATTMVHEIGHNLGLAHDDDCVCPRLDEDDAKCIMNSKSVGMCFLIPYFIGLFAMQQFMNLNSNCFEN